MGLLRQHGRQNRYVASDKLDGYRDSLLLHHYSILSYSAFMVGCLDRRLQPVIANIFIAAIVMLFGWPFALEQNGETLSGSKYSFCGCRVRESGYAVSLISVFHPYKEYLLALRILLFCSEAYLAWMASLLRRWPITDYQLSVWRTDPKSTVASFSWSDE